MSRVRYSNYTDSEIVNVMQRFNKIRRGTKNYTQRAYKRARDLTINAYQKTVSAYQRTAFLYRNGMYFFIILLFIFVFASLYNDIRQPPGTMIIRSTTNNIDEFIKGDIFADLRISHEYGILSAAVYKNDNNDNSECDIGEFIRSEWKEIKLNGLPEKPRDAKSWYFQFKGLDFKIWQKLTPRNPNTPLVVIAFRGTDGAEDFWSNFRWLTRWIPFTWDQYDHVRTLAPVIEEKLRTELSEDVVIVATGHSLGGGLAQHAAYSSEFIKTVYAFDSSSVTGFFSIGHQDRNRRKKGMKIYRIYERGEILAYLRWFMKQVIPVTATNPKIVEVRYDFASHSGNSIEKHSIRELACNLRTTVLPENSSQ